MRQDSSGFLLRRPCTRLVAGVASPAAGASVGGEGSRRRPDCRGNSMADIAKHLLKRRVAERHRIRRSSPDAAKLCVIESAPRQKFRGFRPQRGARHAAVIAALR
jgi:hypothetical protein